jgi:hypothetical protein
MGPHGPAWHCQTAPSGSGTAWGGCGCFRLARISMADDSLHQSHNKHFRAAFSAPRSAAAFLRHHLGSTEEGKW